MVCFYRSGEEKPIEADKKLIKADKKPINTERKDVIIKYIKENGSITNREAREILGLAESTTKRMLKEMVGENILIIEGERKTRRYLLSEKTG